MKKLFLLLTFLLGFQLSFAQVPCPPNIDFEQNTFTGWIGRTGYRGTSQVPNPTLPSSGVIAGRQTLTSGGIDPYGLFPRVSPLGGLHSMQVGNDRVNDSTESIEYHFTVPSVTNFYLTYLYAIVLNAPCGSHSGTQTPFFYIEVRDSLTNKIIQCDSLSFSPCVGSTLNTGFGFQTSTLVANGDPVIYKPWSAGLIKIKGYSGRRVIIRCVTGDCTLGGHFGYGYFDLLSSCATASILNGYCPGSTQGTLYGPPGFQGYTWTDSTLVYVLGTGQTVTFPIPPNYTDSFKINLILTPFNGLGCTDTVSTMVYPQPPPTAYFWAPTHYCVGSPVQFLDSSVTATLGSIINYWHWNFGDPNSGPNDSSFIQNPTHMFNTMGTYTVSLIVHNNIACVSDTFYRTIHIDKPFPLMGLVATPDSICTYDTTTITATIPGNVPSNLTYIWNIGSGQLVSGSLNSPNPISVKWTTKGIKIVTLDVIAAPSDTFCSINRSVIINVMGDVPHFMITGIDTICPLGNDTLHLGGVSNVCGVSTYPASGGGLFTLGTNTPTSATANLPTPFRGFYTESKCQMLYTAAELIAAGIQPGVITELGWNVVNKASTTSSQSGCGSQPYGGFTISIACVSYNNLMTIDKNTTLTQVYSTPTYNTTAGMNMFPLQVLYVWDGVSNLLVQTCFDNGVSCWTQDDRVAKTNVGVGYCTYAYSDTDPLLGCNQNYPQNATIWTNSDRPDITFRVASIVLPATTTFSWTSQPAGFTSTLQSPPVNPSMTTTYYVTANDGGCMTKDSFKVNVTSSLVKLPNDTTICKGQSLNIVANASNVQTWVWSPNVSSTNTANVTPQTTSTYHVSVQNNQGCNSSDSMIVTVNKTTITNQTNDTSVCKNQPINMQVWSNGMTYTWTTNNSGSLSSTSSTSPFTPTVSNIVTIIASDIFGCKDTTNINVHVRPTPTSIFNFDNSICFGQCDTFHYAGNGGPNTTFSWNTNGGTYSSGLSSDPVYCWSTPGVKNITLTVTDSGCVSSTTQQLNIHTGTKPTIVGNDSLCVGGSSLLTALPSGNLYVWGGGQTTDTIHISKSGTYKVVMFNQWGCKDSTTKKVTYFPLPIANAGRDTTVLVGNPVTIDGTNSYDAMSYLWSNGVSSPTYVVYPSNDSTFDLMVINSHGCIDHDSVTIYVLQCRPPMVPNAFSPNGDGLDDVFKIMNPEDFARLQNFMVFNRWGQLIYNTNEKSKGWDGKFQGLDQEVGGYVYMIITNCNSNQVQVKGNVVLIR